MVEPETIEGIFRNLDTYLDQLHQLAALRREELADDLVKAGAPLLGGGCEHSLRRIAEQPQRLRSL